MKRIHTILLTSICSMFFMCETNDPLYELGEPGNFATNIYFVPLSPIAFVNTSIETEVEYWSKGDDFTSIDFMHAIYLQDKLSLELKDVNYSYSFEGLRDKVEKEVFQSIPHRFTNFVPERNAYVIYPTYEIPQEYKKLVRNKNNTTLSALDAAIPLEAKDDFYVTLGDGLSKSQLQIVLVDINNIITQETFDSYYDGEVLTENGKQGVISGLKTVGIPGLIKDNYYYEVIHRVALSFIMVNVYGEEAESVIRAFNVN